MVIGRFGAFVVVALLLFGCAPEKSQFQRGRVLDQDTGKPIAGAIVVGRYIGGVAWGGSSCNRAESTTSDEHGWFELPVDRDAGTILEAAYKRGYDPGNRIRMAFETEHGSGQWRVSIYKWDEVNRQSIIVGVDPVTYTTESAAKEASGEDTDVPMRQSTGQREIRLWKLRTYEKDCAGRPRTSAGLVPFIEAILKEQTELGDEQSRIASTQFYLDVARKRQLDAPTAKR